MISYLALIAKYAGYFCFFCGTLIAISTVIGFLRFLNPFTQVHIATIFEMLGFPLFLFGAIFLNLANQNIMLNLKILFIFVAWYLVSPIMSYSLIKIIYFYDKKI